MTPSNHVIDEIGRQHAALSSLFDDLSECIFDVGRRLDAAEHLAHLMLEIGAHFGFEEAQMEAGEYPQFDHHRRQHMAMMIEFGLLLDKVEEGGNESAVLRGVEMLKRWFEQHIDHSDSQLERWLASRG